MLVVGLMSCTISSGSSGARDARDAMKCRESVELAYPDAIVYPVPDKKYLFIVMRDNCEVLLVSTMDLNSPKVTSVNVIKRSK